MCPGVFALGTGGFYFATDVAAGVDAGLTEVSHDCLLEIESGKWKMENCPGFVSDTRGVFRSDAGQRDGKPQGVGRQMRRLFTRTPVPDVANVRYTGNSRQDVEGRRSGRDVLGMGRLL